RPPSEQALVAGWGDRALALAVAPDPGLDEVRSVLAWESLDGGQTWDEITVTRAVAREVLTGLMTLSCGSGGCLAGSTITRVGWKGQGEGPVLNHAGSVEPRKEPAVRTPIICELDARAGWTRIDDVDSRPNAYFGLPGVDEAMRGRSLWSVI